MIVNFFPSLHGINFSRSISSNNTILASLDSSRLEKELYNVCVADFFMFCMYRVPTCFASMVIIICDGEKQSSRRSILFQAVCCGSQQPVLDS